MLCVHHCAVHRFCVAINYKEKLEENTPNCQLTNTTIQKFDENASKKDNVWTFRKVDADRSLVVSIRNAFYNVTFMGRKRIALHATFSHSHAPDGF